MTDTSSAPAPFTFKQRCERMAWELWYNAEHRMCFGDYAPDNQAVIDALVASGIAFVVSTSEYTLKGWNYGSRQTPDRIIHQTLIELTREGIDLMYLKDLAQRMHSLGERYVLWGEPSVDAYLAKYNPAYYERFFLPRKARREGRAA